MYIVRLATFLGRRPKKMCGFISPKAFFFFALLLRICSLFFFPFFRLIFQFFLGRRADPGETNGTLSFVYLGITCCPFVQHSSIILCLIGLHLFQ